MSITVKAVAKAVRMSPRKVYEVASLVQGRSVADALVILEHTPRRAAQPVYKVIASAAANAEHNHKLDPKTLMIANLEVGQGFALKRFRPAAHGRALPYKKMTSNITVAVTGAEKVKKAPKAKSTTTTKTTEKKSAEGEEK
jgi:large subunit ribosomal protein L22